MTLYCRAVPVPTFRPQVDDKEGLHTHISGWCTEVLLYYPKHISS